MFVRFRQAGSRLQVSLVATSREGGRVKHEHVAGLGTIETEPSIEARLAFWSHLHARLAKLSNRLSAEEQAKILGAIHARVPMVTPDEAAGTATVQCRGGREVLQGAMTSLARGPKIWRTL